MTASTEEPGFSFGVVVENFRMPRLQTMMTAMTGDEFREMALQFAGTETAPHFDRVAFKVVKRRSFATYLESDNTANIFLTPDEQKAFCRMDKKNIFPVPNKWGERGATTFILERVDPSLVREALLSAYSSIVD